MKQSQVVYLEISSFRGVSIGAQHWYGKLVCTDPYRSVELKRTLTDKQAQELNDSRDREFPGDTHSYKYRAGYKTNGFDSESSIKKFAKKEYKKHFHDAKILLLGRCAYSEPHLVLDGPDEFKKLSKKMRGQCEKLNWYDGKNSDEVDRITTEWESLLNNL